MWTLYQLNNVSIEHNWPLFDNMGPNEFTPPDYQYNIEYRISTQTTIDPSNRGEGCYKFLHVWGAQQPYALASWPSGNWLMRFEPSHNESKPQLIKTTWLCHRRDPWSKTRPGNLFNWLHLQNEFVQLTFINWPISVAFCLFDTVWYLMSCYHHLEVLSPATLVCRSGDELKLGTVLLLKKKSSNCLHQKIWLQSQEINKKALGL